MSFMLTTEQMRTREKTVTRRLGWWNLKPGDLVQAVEKGMGLKKGQKIKPIGVIRITSVRAELLNAMLIDRLYGRAECFREGFPEVHPHEFVRMFCNTHKGCTPHTLVNRIEFEHV